MGRRKREKPQQLYETEVDLCSALIDRAAQDGWTAYPEIKGWDIILVRGGIQIGIQAKLRFGAKVVAQALQGLPKICESGEKQIGPHYRAIACPLTRSSNDDAYRIGRMCRLLVLDMNRSPDVGYFAHWRHMRHGPYINAVHWRYYRWHPDATLWLPPMVPNIAAGSKSPRACGPWQLVACRVMGIVEKRGWISRMDVQLACKEFEGSFNASSVLTRYFVCTHEPDPRDTKKKQWKHAKWASDPRKEYPEAAKMIGDVDATDTL
jgi:hypothetical protein